MASSLEKAARSEGVWWLSTTRKETIAANDTAYIPHTVYTCLLKCMCLFSTSSVSTCVFVVC